MSQENDGMGTQTQVLYIGGMGRSGSTLLNRLLGTINGFFAAGELRHIWKFGYINNHICGCGVPFSDCRVWQEVSQRAFGHLDEFDPIEMLNLDRKTVRWRRIPTIRFKSLIDKDYSKLLKKYTEVLEGLYRAMSLSTGCKVIVDSSKDPRFAYLLNQAPRIDLRVLHLARDSRAVAYSWQRKKKITKIGDRDEYLDRFTPWRSAYQWNVANLSMELLRPITNYYHIMRYEDFVLDPEPEINRALAVLGLDHKFEMPDRDVALELTENHNFSGNAIRLKRGSLKIKADMEWDGKMKLLDRALVSVLTWPLLLKYGYLH